MYFFLQLLLAFAIFPISFPFYDLFKLNLSRDVVIKVTFITFFLNTLLIRLRFMFSFQFQDG